MRNWYSFHTVNCVFDANSLDANLSLEPSDGISSLNSTNFEWSELVDKITDSHISSADSHKDLVSFFNLDVDSSLTKLVDPFGFSQEHDLHLFLFWVGIDEIGEGYVNLICFPWDVSAHQVVQLVLEELELIIKLT